MRTSIRLPTSSLTASCKLTKSYRVTTDSAVSSSFFVHLTDDQHVIEFKQCFHGLYYFDMSDHVNTTNSVVTPYSYSFLSTVAKNKEYFTRREIRGADLARDLQGRIAWPSDDEYKNIVSNNLLTNCTVQVDDISRADHLYGPLKPILEGKSVRQRPPHCENKKRRCVFLTDCCLV